MDSRSSEIGIRTAAGAHRQSDCSVTQPASVCWYWGRRHSTVYDISPLLHRLPSFFTGLGTVGSGKLLSRTNTAFTTTSSWILLVSPIVLSPSPYPDTDPCEASPFTEAELYKAGLLGEGEFNVNCCQGMPSSAVCAS